MTQAYSWMLGTVGLWLFLAMGVVLSLALPLRHDTRTIRAVLWWGFTAVGEQTLHFLEEVTLGFPQGFPQLLGLPPWDTLPFVLFNLTWLAIWSAALLGFGMGYRWAEWPIWFFALALIGNGLGHPALSMAVGGYFPGLLTSPLLAITGMILMKHLLRGSGAASPPVESTAPSGT